MQRTDLQKLVEVGRKKSLLFDSNLLKMAMRMFDVNSQIGQGTLVCKIQLGFDVDDL